MKPKFSFSHTGVHHFNEPNVAPAPEAVVEKKGLKGMFKDMSTGQKVVTGAVVGLAAYGTVEVGKKLFSGRRKKEVPEPAEQSAAEQPAAEQAAPAETKKEDKKK